MQRWWAQRGRQLSCAKTMRRFVSWFRFDSAAEENDQGPRTVPCEANRNLPGFTETRLRGWAYRTRTRKCRFFVISGELLGFTEHFRTRDFSRTPRRDRCKSRWVKATFASSSPICPATQSGLYRLTSRMSPAPGERVEAKTPLTRLRSMAG